MLGHGRLGETPAAGQFDDRRPAGAAEMFEDGGVGSPRVRMRPAVSWDIHKR